ncbi:MAG: putative DNA-binding domain-containing protein [Pseudomonadota bacterium]
MKTPPTESLASDRHLTIKPMNENLPSFQRYQLAFSAHIRDPVHQPRPQHVPARRMAVYKEIVLNNLLEAISACFPVAQKTLGKRAWLKLVRSFLCDHSANTPIFREIPEEFLAYLHTLNDIPPYLASLCHYEWMELFVASSMTSTDATIRKITATDDLLEYQIVFVATMQILSYNYAVQKISPRYKPSEQVSTQLLMYRDAEFIVRFVELNSVTYRLIELLQQAPTTGRQALTTIADELAHPEPETVVQFGLGVLQDLKTQGIIIGVTAN